MNRSRPDIRTGVVFVTLILLAVSLGGCATDWSNGGDATTGKIQTRNMATLPPGALPRTLAIDPFTMSSIIAIDPDIKLTREELCRLVTERARMELVGGQQFRIVDDPSGADYVLRGQLVEMIAGAQVTTNDSAFWFMKGNSGDGSDTQKVRPLDVIVEGELVDTRTGSAVCYGKGMGQREVLLEQKAAGNNTADGNNGGGTTMTGYEFNQQHLQRVFMIAANELAVDLSEKANTAIFIPESQSQRAGSNNGHYTTTQAPMPESSLDIPSIKPYRPSKEPR